MNPYERLENLGMRLPPAPRPVATYLPFVQVRDMIYLSGQGPRAQNGALRTGKVGRDVDVERAYDDARLTGLNLLSVLHEATGDLRRVTQVVKLLGMVNAVPEFGSHPQVIDGCSDLFVAVFGNIGRHARSAVGFGSLPGNITVEIEAIVAVT